METLGGMQSGEPEEKAALDAARVADVVKNFHRPREIQPGEAVAIPEISYEGFQILAGEGSEAKNKNLRTFVFNLAEACTTYLNARIVKDNFDSHNARRHARRLLKKSDPETKEVYENNRLKVTSLNHIYGNISALTYFADMYGFQSEKFDRFKALVEKIPPAPEKNSEYAVLLFAQKMEIAEKLEEFCKGFLKLVAKEGGE